MELQIRRALHQDASNIIAAHRRSIRELCSKDYTSEQIDAWAGVNFREDRWHQTMDQDLVWVISDLQNNILGFGHLHFLEDKEAEVEGLYFVPEAVGHGLGKKIVQLMFDECRLKNVILVKLSATKTAKKFYEHVGFKQVGPPSLVKIGGKDIECFKMRLNLI